MKRILLFILCMCCLSCQERKIADYIDDGDYKFWYKQNGTCIEFYFFDSNGYWTMFEKYMFSSLSEFFSDEMLTDKWELHGDSILQFNNIEHKIVLVSDTMLIIEKNAVSDTLRAAPKDAIPEKFKHKGPFAVERNGKRNFWYETGKTFYWDE